MYWRFSIVNNFIYVIQYMNMTTKNFHLIPYLSKELNLLGYPKLPFIIKSEKPPDRESELGSNEKQSDISDMDHTECSDSDYVHISFNTKEMIGCLISACDDLIKSVKVSSESEQFPDEYNELKFKYCNLKKQESSIKKELEDNKKLVSVMEEKFRQLNVKLKECQKKVNDVEKEKSKILKEQKLNEEMWKVRNNKVQKDLAQTQKLLCSQSQVGERNNCVNCLDSDYLKQSSAVRNLWSNVKYFRYSKEAALHNALCIYEENNVSLMEENGSLKALLFSTIEEINYLITFFSNKTGIPLKTFDEKEVRKIIYKKKSIQIQAYKSYLQKYTEFFINIVQYFKDCSFFVGDQLFLCLSDITDMIKKFICD